MYIRHTYIHIIYTDIYTYTSQMHGFTHTYISIHRCTRTHDYAHVHAMLSFDL